MNRVTFFEFFRSYFSDYFTIDLQGFKDGARVMARSLSVDSGYDRWKDSAVEQRSREPIGTFPSVTVRTGRSGNITDALVSTTEYQTNSGEKGEAQVQGMSGAPVEILSTQRIPRG